MSAALNKAADRLVDTVEALASTQTSRTGHSAARVASALANDVDPEVLALQLTLNSRKNSPDNPVMFTARDVSTIAKFYEANRTRSGLTKRQTRALVREQKHAEDMPFPA